MTAFRCDRAGCTVAAPHDHSFVYPEHGDPRPAIVYHVEDLRAEVRDPDTGEVIFPAVKGPLKLIQGGLPHPPMEA